MAFKSILVKENSPTSNRLECGTCKQKFWMTCKYIDHMSTHRHFSYSCNICNKRFSDQKLLDEHYITHKEVVNTYDCNQCTRKFLQKYQLEQHMQFHISLAPPNQSSLKIKKSVHFNILESRNTDSDSSDSDFLVSDDSGSDFYEIYKTSDKITKTRSGRIVKTKKLFDDEPEMKRRRKSSDEAFEKESINLENVEQSLRLKAANKINVVTGRSSPISSPANSSTLSKEVFNKKLVILTEKLPEHVYRSYAMEVNDCNFDSSRNHKSANGYASSNFQTEFSNSGTSNCSQHINVTPTSKKLACEARIDNTEINTSNKSDLNGDKNSNAILITSSSQLPIKPIQNGSSPAKDINSIPKISFLTPPPSNESIATSNIYTSPSRVDKQFLYVGPKQDINKIKNIIEEMKTMPTPSVKTLESQLVVESNNSGLSRSICNKSSPKVGNLNGDNLNTDSCKGMLRGNELNEQESTNGILEKRVLKDFILIKVTPELMKKMQTDTLSSIPRRQENVESFSTVQPANILPMSSGLNKDLREISQMTEKNGTPELMQKVQKETLLSTPRRHGDIKSFSALKPANILPMSSGLNKDLSEITHMTENNGAPELTQNVLRETVSPQTGHGNLEPVSTAKPAHILPVSPSLNKDLYKVSHKTDKNGAPELGQKVQKDTSVSLQMGHDNFKLISAAKPVHILPLSASLNKDLCKVSHKTDKNRTPELKQKVQRETSVSPQMGHGNLELVTTAKPANILSVSFSSNKDMTELSHMTEKVRTIEVNDAPKYPKVVSTSNSNIVDISINSHIEKYVNLKNSETISTHKVTAGSLISKIIKVPKQKTELNNSNDKECTETFPSKSELSYSSIKDKLLERYKAKIEEKERKKKEKYEFKKKMHYMEKTICKNNLNTTVSIQKKPEIKSSNILNIYKKAMLVLTETHNNCFISSRNFEDNEELLLESNKRTEIVSELKDQNYSSQVTDENNTKGSKSPLKDTIVSTIDFNSKTVQVCEKLKLKQQKFTEKDAVQKAYEISLKFEKTATEEECLNFLDEIDNLITHFNISKRCPFLLPITRFCRLYVESYKVKERAILLYKKITQTSA